MDERTGNSGIIETMDWVVLAAFAIQIPGPLVPLIWGRSGIGKTRIGHVIARILGWFFLPIALNQRIPSDLQGVEIPDPAGGMRVVLPDFFQRARSHAEGALILLDEVGSVPDAMQGAALRLLSERAIDDAPIGEHVRFYAAANPPHIAAGAGEMPEAFSYRFLHIRAKVNPEQVVRWMRGEPTQAETFPILDLDDFRTALPGARATVAAYLSANRAHAEESESDTEGRWPLVGANPRSWEHMAAVLAACNVVGRRDLLPPLATGCLGAPIALPFLSYERTADLPEADTDPAAWTPDPSRPDRTLAILGNVKTWSLNRDDGAPYSAARWLHGWAWVARAVETDARGCAAGLARALADRRVRDSVRAGLRNADPAAVRRALETMSALAPILKHAGPRATTAAEEG